MMRCSKNETGSKPTRTGLRYRFQNLERARIVLEVGTHPPWISRLLNELSHEVIAGNVRDLRSIYRSDRKSGPVNSN